MSHRRRVDAGWRLIGMRTRIAAMIKAMDMSGTHRSGSATPDERTESLGSRGNAVGQ
jgi:glycosyltransferase A (GT-A) superfamily protein (DUF2064 family)